jgi:hypothetical protein
MSEVVVPGRLDPGETETDEMETALSESERLRLQRFRRTRENRRGRQNPAVMPGRLARTSAFAPRRQRLSTDADFERVYVVRPHTVVQVSGRELGSQHRDALYAIFRVRARRISEPNPHYVAGTVDPITGSPRIVYYVTDTTWRELLVATGRTPHVNNLGTLLRSFEEMRSVSFRVFRGDFDAYEAALKRGRLPGAGFSDNLVNRIDWSGVSLDSRVTVRYGEWVKDMFEAKSLVSLNGDVYFRLRSDYAKSFWPFIDSQNAYTFVDIDTLADLSGRDYQNEPVKRRVKFREDIRQALDDMVCAGGLRTWHCEELGSGRRRSYRYHYVHALERQGGLALSPPPVLQLPAPVEAGTDADAI